jgi:hypothetical protein
MDTKTKSRTTTATNAAESLKGLWRDLITNGEFIINADDSRGEITLVNGEPCLRAYDKDDKEILPAERSRKVGAHVLKSQHFRGRRPGSAKREMRFGPPPPPQRDGFLVADPKHPNSIMMRPYVTFKLGCGQRIGCVRNGWPISTKGHFLGLICTETSDGITYPWVEQRLTPETIELILELALAVGPSYAVGYNPKDFGASQEQFHVHIVDDDYAVERAARVRLAGGGSFPLYPAGCLILEKASSATISQWVRRLDAHGILTNLLVRSDVAYIYPRRRGIGIISEFPAGMIAFSELSGVWICSDEIYEVIDEEWLRVALRKVTVPVEDAWGMVMSG